MGVNRASNTMEVEAGFVPSTSHSVFLRLNSLMRYMFVRLFGWSKPTSVLVLVFFVKLLRIKPSIGTNVGAVSLPSCY